MWAPVATLHPESERHGNGAAAPGEPAEGAGTGTEAAPARRPQAAGTLVLPTLDSPTLTKSELAELLFERIGLNKRESKEMVDAFFDLIHASLAAGEETKIAGFGNFSIRRKAPRPGRNPRTGEPIPIKARNVVTFHASQKLKSVVQGAHPAPSEPG